MKGFFVVSLIFVFFWSAGTSLGQKVLELPLAEAVTPLSVGKVKEALCQAEREKAACLVITLDTPGGLVTSMRRLVKVLLNSPVPVVVYVSPAGAQAASAGTFIVLAAHVAAMAPGTNIGAAHPVTMGQKMNPTMAQKMENDLAALARSLAHLRGRNADWAEKAVRKSVSIPANEALKLRVIDLVVPSLPELLAKIDGKVVKTTRGPEVLHTSGAQVIKLHEDLRSRVLRLVTDPNVAYILLMVGLAGLYFELSHPGVLFPGVVGAISLLLAFYAMHVLPVDYAGLALIFLAGVLFFLEIKITSYGLLALAGLLCLLLGSLMLFHGNPVALRASYEVVLPVVMVVGLFFCSVTYLAARAVLRRPTTGAEGLLGEQGEALTTVGPNGGQVFVHGEIWQALSDEEIPKGSKIEVEAVRGLKLKVRQVSGQSQSP